MSGAAVEAPGGSRQERELAYYRREVNDLGAKLIRLQEEQQKTFFEAQRSRLVVKMVRELYGIGDLGVAGASLPDLVLGVVVENAMCACAALFRERQLGSGSFAPVGAVGLPSAERPPLLRLRRTPPFTFTTAAAQPEPPASEIAAYLGAPYILWTYDTASGYALALGNRREANASRPFDLADQELIETALTVFLDAQSRVPRAPIDSGKGGAGSGDGAEEQCGLEGGEPLRQQLSRGGRILGVLVVERPSAEGCEYVAYLNVTWKRGWHVLRAYRDRGDRTYRHLNPLFQMVRSDLRFTGPITAYTLDSAEMERLPSVTAHERRQQNRAEHPPAGKSVRASEVQVEARA